jgi:hypothetical protein
MPAFSFPYGMAELHCIKSTAPIKPRQNATPLYLPEKNDCVIYTDHEKDAFFLREGEQWYGLAAFTFCVKTLTHYRDYFISDIKLSSYPIGVYDNEHQSLVKQLRAATERGKAKVIMTKIRAAFEDQLIESVIRPLLPRSDVLEILGTWQLQEKLFELGFKPKSNSYKRGETHGG